MFTEITFRFHFAASSAHVNIEGLLQFARTAYVVVAERLYVSWVLAPFAYLLFCAAFYRYLHAGYAASPVALSDAPFLQVIFCCTLCAVAISTDRE